MFKSEPHRKLLKKMRSLALTLKLLELGCYIANTADKATTDWHSDNRGRFQVKSTTLVQTYHY